ncbi:hypothetical protein [Scytonema sp. PCC 10023]|uniref:hypothetical protein n=1 Tax=Scytonema sp. PCC 10023 TaxID=1680591 RepID=UPI0039C685EE
MPDNHKNTHFVDSHKSSQEEQISNELITLQKDAALSNEVEIEIGKLINLLEELKELRLKMRKRNKLQVFLGGLFTQEREKYIAESEKRLSDMMQLVHSAIILVSHSKPKLVISRKIRRNIEYKVRREKNFILGNLWNIYKYFIHATSTPIKVITGLIIALPIYIILPIITVINIDFISKITYFKQSIIDKEINNSSNENKAPSNSANTYNLTKYTTDSTANDNKKQDKDPLSNYNDFNDYKENIAIIILAGSAGALGSLISILTRIKEYDSEKYEDASLPIIIGAFKPIIGASFGILLVTLISSNTLPIKVDESIPGKKQYFYYSVAFLIGFSERFARDIVSRAERAFTGNRDDNALHTSIDDKNNSDGKSNSDDKK